MAQIGMHLYVSGYVQGVAYRYSAIRQAKSLGLTGWVRNLRDRRVELLVEGEETAVRQMLDWCYQGPRAAQVTDVDVEMCTYSGKFQRFELRM